MNQLPTLYKKTSTGSSQEWTIATDGNAILTTWGAVGGAMQTTKDIIFTGKNLGKKNETSREEQAVLEAQSKWEGKLKKGYVKTLAAAKSGKTDSVITGGFWPMLAKKFRDDGHKIQFPCAVQPKLNGHRCTAIVKNKVAELWSRKRNLITGVPHINRALELLVPDNEEYRFDGEGYNHALHDNLEEIGHFMRNATPQPGCEVVQFHAYDMYTDTSFEDRSALLHGLLHRGADSALSLVETKIVTDEEELIAAFEYYKSQKYEGAMARNLAGLYKSVPPQGRSDDLQKLKPFLDEEFPIVGVVEGRGKLMGHGMFICQAPNGKTFEVKMRGPLEALKAYLARPQDYIGRELTVRFANYTRKGIPFHGVGWDFREDV